MSTYLINDLYQRLIRRIEEGGNGIKSALDLKGPLTKFKEFQTRLKLS